MARSGSLAEWLCSHKGPVVASNQATERIVDLYRSFGFSIKLLDAPRRISCKGDRKPAKEILAYKGLSKGLLNWCSEDV